MKNSITDRKLIRQYLLGKLDEQQEMEDQLSDVILFNDEMMAMVDSVEDEIIEDYLDGSLDSRDRDAVEKYFLRPPERKEKLRFCRLLRHHFDTKPSRHFEAEHQNSVRPPVAWLSHFRTYGQLAALAVVIIAASVYITHLRRTQLRLEAEIAQGRERSSNLVRQAELSEPQIVSLTLVAGRSRGAETQIPQVQIESSTRRIIVEIALQGSVSSSYDVHLETRDGKGPLWSARVGPVISPAGDARLLFDLPTLGIESNVYSFVVSSGSPGSAGPRHYDFRVKLAM